jgi:hypothetical protein
MISSAGNSQTPDVGVTNFFGVVISPNFHCRVSGGLTGLASEFVAK